MKPCNLLLVDPYPIVRRALTPYLATLPGVTVVGETGDADEAVYLANALQPTIILLEPKHLDSLRLVRQLSEVAPRSRIIVYTSYLDLWEKEALLDAAASAYLLKSLDLSELELWLTADGLAMAG